MNGKGTQSATARPEPDHSWLTVGVTFFVVAAICGITAAVSYEHEYELAHRNGQAPWVSGLLPFTVDGMILGASVVLLWAASRGIRRPWRPLAILLVGIAATIAANLASGLGHGWLGAAVAAWSGVALILISDVAMWLTNTRRALLKGERPDRPAGHECPPPPLTLAEWAPLARAQLKQDGEPHGEQALADRIGSTRHQVRQALASLVADAPAGAGSPDAVPAAPAPAGVYPNGHGNHE
jgi:Protein of unknown function (DUF2637)